MIRLTYGYESVSSEDQLNILTTEAFTAEASLGVNGLTLVDLAPIRK